MNDIVTLAEANTYFATRLNSDIWDQSLAANRTKAITTATATISQLNLIDDYTSTATADFPEDMKIAVCEIALKYLGGFDIDREVAKLRIASEKLSGLTTTYVGNDQPQHIIAGVPSVVAWRLLQQYMAFHDTIQMDRIT